MSKPKSIIFRYLFHWFCLTLNNSDESFTEFFKMEFAMKTLIIIFALTSFTFAQEDDPLKYFPYKIGDMWEYFWYDTQYPDTLQNFNIKDSIDAEGNIYVWQSARFINPISPPALLSDTAIYKIDTAYNVFCLNCSFENRFHYKLDAKKDEQWVVYAYPGGGSYEMARVSEVWEDELFGKMTKFKNYTYYYSQDSTDTIGLVRYEVALAKGFGVWWKGGGDAVGDIYLKGCVIDDTLYGDTTNIITSLKDLSENLLTEFELFPNYPNPFNPTTTISFAINKAQNISLIVYDMMGREIKRLIDNEYYSSGIHKTMWDGTNNSNQSISSGVYYYRLTGVGINLTRSMVLLK
jgi:hypothetical protein